MAICLPVLVLKDCWYMKWIVICSPCAGATVPYSNFTVGNPEDKNLHSYISIDQYDLADRQPNYILCGHHLPACSSACSFVFSFLSVMGWFRISLLDFFGCPLLWMEECCSDIMPTLCSVPSPLSSWQPIEETIACHYTPNANSSLHSSQQTTVLSCSLNLVCNLGS